MCSGGSPALSPATASRRELPAGARPTQRLRVRAQRTVDLHAIARPQRRLRVHAAAEDPDVEGPGPKLAKVRIQA